MASNLGLSSSENDESEYLSFTSAEEDYNIQDVDFKFSQLPLEDRDEHLTEEEMNGNGSLYMCNGGLFFATYDKNDNFINKISIDR